MTKNQDVLGDYLTAALWSSTGPDDEPLDANYSADDIAPSTMTRAAADCVSFMAQAAPILDGLADDEKRPSIGHDFWLTRNHHGAGFWDGDYPEEIGDALTKLAQSFCELCPIVGDDGMIYFE